jgi:hypothetical protein
MNSPQAWDGQFLGERVALSVVTETDKGLVIGAACSDSAHVVIYPDQFGQFLLVHVPAELICYDAAVCTTSCCWISGCD